jgi:hypothetical protein
MIYPHQIHIPGSGVLRHNATAQAASLWDNFSKAAQPRLSPRPPANCGADQTDSPRKLNRLPSQIGFVLSYASASQPKYRNNTGRTR